MINKNILLLCLTLVINVQPIAFGQTQSHARPSVKQSRTKATAGNIKASLSEAIDLIKKNYVDSDNLSYNAIFKSSIAGLLRTLDPYSKYWDAGDFEDLKIGLRAGELGIGATVRERRVGGEPGLFILAPATNGLRFGDKISAVDNWDARGHSLDEVRSRLRGPAGSKVRLLVERAGNGDRETLEITREAASRQSVRDAYMLQAGAGYIDLRSGFNLHAAEELNTSLNMLRSKAVTSLVLDLRDNPGGLLEQAIRIAQEFLPAGKAIVTQKGKSANTERRYLSQNTTPNKSPLVVLVNNKTASGAEIVAAALQHHGRALIVGEPTFGQNLVQILIPLPNGSVLTLTNSRSLRASATTSNVSESTSSVVPDETVDGRETDTAQQQLIDPVFGFVRLLVNGRVDGFQNFKVNGPVNFKHDLKPDELQVSNNLFEAFKTFVANEPAYGLTGKQLDANQRFIIRELRYQIATATYGPVIAERILLGDDPQFLRAMQILPKAAALAGASTDN